MGNRAFQSVRPMGLNVIEYKDVIHIVSDSPLHLTFNQSPLVEFWCSIKKEYPQLSKKKKSIKYFSFFQLLVFLRLDFLHTILPKQHISQYSE